MGRSAGDDRDVLAIAGDAVDNIGSALFEKPAANYCAEFRQLARCWRGLGQVKLAENARINSRRAELILQNRKMVELDCHLPLPSAD